MSRTVLARVALFLCLLPGVSAAGQSPQIAAAAAEIDVAGSALAAAAAAPDRIVALSDAISAYEPALGRLRAAVGEAAQREATLATEMAGRREDIERLLAALEALSRTPPQAAGVLHPQGPRGAAWAAAMMERLTPALTSKAQALRGELVALAAARGTHAEGETALAAAETRFEAAHAALAEAIAEAAPASAAPVSPELMAMARASESLTALAAALAAADDAPAKPTKPAEGLRWPVAGEVLFHYNEPDAARVRRPGILLSAPPLSLVRAPADAAVRYAGPFLEYGYVVVLEPAAETLLVLAGLGQLRVAAGTTVHRGDLVGLLGGRLPNADEDVIAPESETGAGGDETLYIEVRQGRGPVDPEPMFAGENG